MLENVSHPLSIQCMYLYHRDRQKNNTQKTISFTHSKDFPCSCMESLILYISTHLYILAICCYWAYWTKKHCEGVLPLCGIVIEHIGQNTGIHISVCLEPPLPTHCTVWRNLGYQFSVRFYWKAVLTKFSYQGIWAKAAHLFHFFQSYGWNI